jgi:hypothetical protein
LVDRLVEEFEVDNDAFNAARFKSACGYRQ